MWNILGAKSSLELKALASMRRFYTLAELANLLPDSYHCPQCNNLNNVDPLDVPDCWTEPNHRPECDFGTYNDTLRAGFEYVLLFHHVQLALKYTRMKSKHQDYRANILKKYQDFKPFDTSITKTYTAKPKVVENKFLLRGVFVLDASSIRDPRGKRCHDTIRFCPHQYFHLGDGPEYTFQATLHRAANNTNASQDQHVQLFSCDCCPTDYQIMATEGDEIIVKAFYDLEMGRSRLDPCWKRHLFPIEGSHFDYEHGSISRMYSFDE